jgi:tetratricopeptide (TPR) repeat protein
MRVFIGFLLVAVFIFSVGLMAQHREKAFGLIDYQLTRLQAWQLGVWHQDAARVDVLTKAVVRYPKDAAFHLALAKMYDSLGYKQRAIIHYFYALQCDPKLYSALLGAARLSRLNQQWHVARLLYQRALHLNPRDPVLLTELGDLYLDAAQALPEPTRSYEWAAYAYRRSFRLQWAAYYFKKSLQRRSKHFRTRFELGYIRLEQRQALAAAWNFCKALAIKPNRYEARYNLGLALLEGGFPKHGYATLKQAVEVLERTHDDLAAAQMRVQIQALKSRFPLPADKSASLYPEQLWQELPTDCIQLPQTEKQKPSRG